MDYQNIIASLDEEIARLEDARAVLRLNFKAESAIGKVTKTSKTAKRVMSTEARKRIAEAQRQRWAKVKKANKTVAARVKKNTANKVAPENAIKAVSAKAVNAKASAKSDGSKTEAIPF